MFRMRGGHRSCELSIGRHSEAIPKNERDSSLIKMLADFNFELARSLDRGEIDDRLATELRRHLQEASHRLNAQPRQSTTA
jgi:hypothetical protein